MLAGGNNIQQSPSARSELTTGDVEYNISPVGEAAQGLVVDGGLENWVKKNLKK